MCEIGLLQMLENGTVANKLLREECSLSKRCPISIGKTRYAPCSVCFCTCDSILMFFCFSVFEYFREESSLSSRVQTVILTFRYLCCGQFVEISDMSA